MGSIAKAITPAASLTLHYGEQMLKGVSAEQFARLAAGADGKPVRSNHPAWVYGHLAIYAQRCFELMGIECPPEARAPVGFEALFKNGTECLDDAAGTIYPEMEVITAAFFKGYRAVLARLPEASDESLLRPNPAEGRFKELFPTCGAALTFMTSGHPMSHFGQVSTWRRCKGLGSAM